MLIVGILFGLVVAAFLAIILLAVIRGQPISNGSLERFHSPSASGPFSGAEYSSSWVVRAAAQGLDPMGRHADWIHPAEAADIVLRGGRRSDE